MEENIDVEEKWQEFLNAEGWQISKEIYDNLQATSRVLDTDDGTHAKWSSDGKLGLLLVFDDDEADALVATYFAGMDGSDEAQSSFGLWVASLINMLDACLEDLPTDREIESP